MKNFLTDMNNNFCLNKDVQCRARLIIKNGIYILKGKHDHEKSLFQLKLKKKSKDHKNMKQQE